jgi:hypothetical protein
MERRTTDVAADVGGWACDDAHINTITETHIVDAIRQLGITPPGKDRAVWYRAYER